MEGPGPKPRAVPADDLGAVAHPANAPSPRPHPGTDVLRAHVPAPIEDRRVGTRIAEGSLEDRIARFISAPLSPVEVRELPCHPSFRETETTEWRIGSASIRAGSVTHRGRRSATGSKRTARPSATSPTTSPGSARHSRTLTTTGSPGSTSLATPRCWSTIASTPTASTPSTSAGVTRRSPMLLRSGIARTRPAAPLPS